ncbi:DUF7312 domain-containing protein [Halobaculum roseum]|uniref:DUF7312 domain-containing protein n=1 Tax=Halobaculum roseum TaxID=2175149 RepID=A0ABD5MGI4_9EURY|nr:hypothetical protein [Halobaculum roseum]QZY02333.1 hypothetical protein K6T36_13680 [Halobaculum roseum]
MSDDPRTDAAGRVDPDGDSDDDGEQWRFAIDEVGPEAEAAREAARNPPIEPESIDAENALFVVAGVLGTLLLVFSVTL